MTAKKKSPSRFPPRTSQTYCIGGWEIKRVSPRVRRGCLASTRVLSSLHVNIREGHDLIAADEFCPQIPIREYWENGNSRLMKILKLGK